MKIEGFICTQCTTQSPCFIYGVDWIELGCPDQREIDEDYPPKWEKALVEFNDYGKIEGFELIRKKKVD